MPLPEEEKLLTELKVPTRPDATLAKRGTPWWTIKWLVPATALLTIVGVFGDKAIIVARPNSRERSLPNSP